MSGSLTHARIWRAIDDLAERHGLSASGLAVKAGLDPTIFNPSKRFGRDGRPRWPSTESLARILDATGESVLRFFESNSEEPTGGPSPRSTVLDGEAKRGLSTKAKSVVRLL